MWLVAAALLAKLMVPAGYMPVMAGGSVVLQLCSGFGPETMVAAMPGMAHHHGTRDHPQRGDMPCGFAGHAAPSMAGADPVLLVVAIAFIIATLFRVPVSRRVERVAFLRPHPRGPPAI